MDVRAVTDPGAWDRLLATFAYPPFTQLWAWGKVQEALGKRVARLAMETDRGPVLAQWVEERRGPLSYWFSPQGPVLPIGTSVQELGGFVEACRSALPGGLRVCFDRCEPRWRKTDDIVSIGRPFVWPGARRVASLNPSTSYVVPLRGTHAEVFETFHKKTRYNIRLAERHHVIVRGATEDDLPIFLRLMAETARRDGFRPHDDEYLSTVYRVLRAEDRCRLRIAEHLGKPLAANLEVLCGDTVMYLYGASSSEERERMPTYALQWSAIFAAVQEGYRWYDFGGGNPVDPGSPDARPSWESMTRFKERWGTVPLAEPGTWDLPRLRLAYRLLVRR